MSNILYLILATVIGYFFGAIPVGFLLVKLTKGIDLRRFGSGRTGGTNSFRAGGVAVGVLTTVLDVVRYSSPCSIWGV